METKIFKKIEEIPESDWLGVYPPVAENYSFFKTLDNLHFKGFKLYYLLGYDNSVPVFATTLFLMDFQLDMALTGVFKKLTRAVKKVFPKLLSVKLLFCGSISGRGRIGIAGNTKGAMNAILLEMEKLARKERALALVFKDFDSSQDIAMQELLNKGFVRMHSLPTSVLKIDFNSFESYLQKLSSSSRQGFRRKFKKIKDNPDFDLEITDNITPELSWQMYDLYLQTVEDSQIEFEEVPPNYFELISRNMLGVAKCFLWRLDGKLIAFAHCLIKGDYFLDYYLGFDYEYAYKFNLYLVRFKKLLEWCINNNMKYYEIGQSNYEIKRRLGFDFLPLYVYSRPCNKLYMPQFKFYHKFMTFEKFLPVIESKNDLNKN